ncbi:MAG TPA: phospholipase D-like domain-containing protein [Anaerolineae bacterium]
MSKRRKRRSNKSDLTLGGILVIILLALIAYLVDSDELNIGDILNPEPVVVARGGEDWYEIYFTNPDCGSEEQRSGGLDETIAEDLRAAELQVDVAAYDLDARPIVGALIDLAERGIRVRVVTDSDNAALPGINRLRQSGITVVEDERSALMHNKFIVIDGRFVWTGSMNLTSNGAYCNNNNFVRFDSPELAANYLAEMDEMYVEALFGPRSPASTPNQRIRFDGVLVENYFAPEEKLAPMIAQTVAGAQSEILFMAFAFTHEDVGDAIVMRAQNGIAVRGVFETTGSSTPFSYFPAMQSAGLDNLQVRQDGNNRIMHHKVIVVDRDTVIFGSFNFTASADDSNDENIIIVHDPTFASFFVEEFESVWNEARP